MSGILLQSFPRYPLLNGHTPVQELKQLNKQLKGVRVFVKRDDLTGIGLGGNKLRKLEFLLGDALQQGADYIVTTGARQSNHARLTAAATATAGLPCELLLVRMVPNTTDDYVNNGNIVLDHIFGANIVDLPTGTDVMQYAQERVTVLKAAGKLPYLIPTGGSSALGCLGYANCVFEIQEQLAGLGARMDYVIVPNGSSGTHAGLLAGVVAGGADIKVRSYNVLAEPADALKNTLEKANAALQLMQPAGAIPETAVDINSEYKGEGYGIPTAAMKEALHLLARTEGILLDPVYSGKAFSGLLGDIRKGVFPAGTNVLFIVTGGTPGLFAYRSVFENQ